jgi:hypothetical protein
MHAQLPLLLFSFFFIFLLLLLPLPLLSARPASSLFFYLFFIFSSSSLLSLRSPLLSQICTPSTLFFFFLFSSLSLSYLHAQLPLLLFLLLSLPSLVGLVWFVGEFFWAVMGVLQVMVKVRKKRVRNDN